jgi:hypothetical protein
LTLHPHDVVWTGRIHADFPEHHVVPEETFFGVMDVEVKGVPTARRAEA